MRVFVEYNEPTGPISGLGLGDGTPGESYYRKMCFFDFFLVRCIEAQRASSGGPTRFLKDPLRAQEKTQRALHPGLLFGSLARCGRPFLGSLAPLVLILVLAL